MPCRWVRLILVLADDLSHDAMADIFEQLQQKVVCLVERPYLAEGVPLRTLTLLTALLEVNLNLPEVHQPSLCLQIRSHTSGGVTRPIITVRTT